MEPADEAKAPQDNREAMMGKPAAPGEPWAEIGQPTLRVTEDDARRAGDMIGVQWGWIQLPLFKRALEIELEKSYKSGEDLGINWALVTEERFVPVIITGVLCRKGHQILQNLTRDASYYERIDPNAGRPTPVHSRRPEPPPPLWPPNPRSTMPLSDSCSLLIDAVRVNAGRNPIQWKVGSILVIVLFLFFTTLARS